MGKGKTSAAIEYINSHPGQRFLYITPFLTEVERVRVSCPAAAFETPEPRGSKLADIKRLLSEHCNVTSTHALFSYFDAEVEELIRGGGYTLFMDEVSDVVHQLKISDDDFGTLLEKYTTRDEDGKLVWTADSYNGVFNPYRNILKNNSLIFCSEGAAVWMFPPEIFRAFNDVFVMTYMFRHQLQRCYFDFYGIDYEYIWVERSGDGRYMFSDRQVLYDQTEYAPLIHLLNDPKANAVGESATALSKTWYIHAKDEALSELKRNASTFFRRRARCKSRDCMWTTFQDFRSCIAGDGFAKGFLSCNARATNEYKNRTAAAYLVNRYMNPVVKNFFHNNGIEIDDDGFALSEMVQWIWRSAIRDGKEITLYIPSARMRGLLMGWLGIETEGSMQWQKEELNGK